MDKKRILETLIFIDGALKKEHHLLINENSPIHRRIRESIKELNNESIKIK